MPHLKLSEKFGKKVNEVREILALFCYLIALILVKIVLNALKLRKYLKKLSLKPSGAS